MTPTVFEVLSKQYRDWCTSIFGDDETANDSLRHAKVAVVDAAFDDFSPGDYVLVWDRGIVAGPVGSKVRKRLVAWANRMELIHDVQDNVRVIWERVA